MMTYPNSREKTFAKNMNQWYLRYSKQMEKILKILLPLIYLPNFQKNCQKFIIPKTLIGLGIEEINGENKVHDIVQYSYKKLEKLLSSQMKNFTFHQRLKNF